jgi:hypothetical protein
MMPGPRMLLDPIADAARRAWQRKARTRPCAFCGFREGHGMPGRVEGHHVLPLRNLKTEHVPELAWYDQRLQLPLCVDPAPNNCHARVENWVGDYRQRITRAFVLARCPGVLTYAREHGIEWLFDRLYPDER